PGHLLERSCELHGIRHARVPKGLRLEPKEGRVSHAAGARAGQERAGAGKHEEGRELRSPTPTLHIARNDGAGLVTLLQASKGKLIFRMSESERSLLLTLFDLYPRVPSASGLSRRGGKPRHSEDTEGLLEEALAEQRAETKKRLKTFLD